MNNEEYRKVINLYRKKEITQEEFDNKILEIVNNLASPLKEFYVICSYFDNYYSVPKDYRNYLYTNFFAIIDSDKLSNNDKSKIKCALMNAFFSDCNYVVAETCASELLNEFSNDVKILRDLANYYTKTRRYRIAENLYKIIINVGEHNLVLHDYKLLKKIINKQQKEYLPTLAENKEKYYNFMNYLGIQIEEQKKQVNSYKVNVYPTSMININADFDSFVAFDLETTGINHKRDAITEIAAIKVVNGKIIESKEFTFQELVHPYQRRIPKNVEKLTGITNEMVQDAKKIWEVLPEFVNFIGNNILLGYNCNIFDRKFLERAGEISNIEINNGYFDVLYMARQYKNSNKFFSEGLKLIQVGEALGIKNPQAHRALADAITTAKIYLALKNMK